MTTLPVGEVKTHLSELVGRVHDHHERVTVTVHGHPSAVLVAVEDLERLEETLTSCGTPTPCAGSESPTPNSHAATK
jgi:antitoxin YefM